MRVSPVDAQRSFQFCFTSSREGAEADADLRAFRRGYITTASGEMSVVWICSCAVLTGWILTRGRASGVVTAENIHSCNWTCMLFTIQWPGSFCLSLNNKGLCKLPPNIQNWTIHGLWPLHAHSCCTCWPIYHSHLQELEPQLSQLWPSLVKSRTYFAFWKDEWYKHGTCAACVESMGSSSDYFRTSLKLWMLFNVDNALADAGITPSCNVSYKYDELQRALGPALGDNAVLQCVKDEKGREAWVQLKILISKNVTLGCPKEVEHHLLQRETTTNTTGHPCPKNTTIFYFPIDHEHPTEPCV